jgi:hypothetical protein
VIDVVNNTLWPFSVMHQPCKTVRTDRC